MNPIAASSEPQTTLLLLVLTPAGQAVWAHVGDSRLYGFSDTDCALRTDDTAYVEHLIHSEKVEPGAASQHRKSTLLSNTVGGQLRQPFLSIGMHEGLQAAELLINKARERAAGKGDNCSMAIIKLVALPAAAVDYTVQRMGRTV